MASAMRKMAVYLGLVEDDHRFQEKYDSYGEYEDYDGQADRPEQADEPDVRGVGRVGEHFREGTPVIMNLTEMVDSDAKRLVDFAAGLIFGLRGSIERVTNKVFLLSPANVEVTAEDKARIAERGFFNQS